MSSRSRSRSALWFGVICLALNVTAGRLDAAGIAPFTPAVFIGGALVLLALVALAAIGYRRALLRNEANRRVIYIVLGMALVSFFGRVIAVWRGASLMTTYAYEQLVYAFVAAVIALLTNRRALVAAVPLFAGALASAALPAFTLEITGLAVFTTMMCLAFIWRPMPREAAYVPDRA